jgi:hypothetical protein
VKSGILWRSEEWNGGRWRGYALGEERWSGFWDEYEDEGEGRGSIFIVKRG